MRPHTARAIARAIWEPAAYVLLVLLVALDVAAHYTSDVDWSGVRNQIQMDDDLGGLFGTAFTFEDTLQQTSRRTAICAWCATAGRLNISPSDDNTLRVVVHKKLYARNQKDADNTTSRPSRKSP